MFARWVPHSLTDQMKSNRVTFCKENLALYGQYGEKWLHSILTEDETRIKKYTPESRFRTREGQPTQSKTTKNSRQSLMLVLFWNKDGPVSSFYYRRSTMNSAAYISNLEQTHQNLLKKTNRKTSRKTNFLHDNAPCHTSHASQDKLNQMGWIQVCHPPYSPAIGVWLSYIE